LKIKAVLFDLGDTLVSLSAPETVFHKILCSFDIHTPIETIKEAVEKTESEFGNVKYEPSYGKVSYEEFWKKWNSRVLMRLGLPADKKVIESTLTKWFDYAECNAYPEVREVLSKLKQIGLKTGIISGAYEEDINIMLEKAHLSEELFDITIGANTIKKSKPHPDVFRYALSKLNVKPDETLFVGDTVEADCKGAESVGIKAVLIKREEAENLTGYSRKINSLEEIFKFID